MFLSLTHSEPWAGSEPPTQLSHYLRNLYLHTTPVFGMLKVFIGLSELSLVSVPTILYTLVFSSRMPLQLPCADRRDAYCKAAAVSLPLSHHPICTPADNLQSNTPLTLILSGPPAAPSLQVHCIICLYCATQPPSEEFFLAWGTGSVDQLTAHARPQFRSSGPV